MGDAGGTLRIGGADGQVWGRGVIRSRRQEPHEVEAEGSVVVPGSHHQDLLCVVVEGGDAGRHTDGEGQPRHTDDDKEGASV